MSTDIGIYHPQIVHFVVAGLLLGILFRWLSLTGWMPWTDRAATVLLLLGTVAAVFAVMSGTQTHELSERIPGAALAVRAHEEAGKGVRKLFLIIATIELLALVPMLAKWRTWIVAASALVCVWGAYQVYNVARLGGVVVYSYAGGVGERTADTTDVNHTIVAALYNRALLDRDQKNAAGAAQEFAELGRRFPNDLQIQMAAAQSQLEDSNDPTAALATLAKFPVPPDTSIWWGRYEFTRADALAAKGQTDSARVLLTALLAQFPESHRIKDKLAKLK